MCFCVRHTSEDVKLRNISWEFMGEVWPRDLDLEIISVFKESGNRKRRGEIRGPGSL